MTSRFEHPDLFPPHSNWTTSLEAAESMVPHVGTIRRKVFDLISRSFDGLTSDELEVLTGFDGSTIRPRVWELRGNGEGPPPVVIRDSGRRRNTRSGRRAIVWEVLGDD